MAVTFRNWVIGFWFNNSTVALFNASLHLNEAVKQTLHFTHNDELLIQVRKRNCSKKVNFDPRLIGLKMCSDDLNG